MSSTQDRWIHRVGVTTLIALAVSLLGIGAHLYAFRPSPAVAAPSAAVQPLSSNPLTSNEE